MKPTNNNMNGKYSIFNELFSFEEILYFLSDISNSEQPFYIKDELSKIYTQDKFLSLHDILEALFLIDRDYAKNFYDEIKNLEENVQSSSKSDIKIEDLEDIIMVTKEEIQNNDFDYFSNALENFSNSQPQIVFQLLDIVDKQLHKVTRVIKNDFKAEYKEEQIIDENFDFNYHKKKQLLVNHPLFVHQDVLQQKRQAIEETAAFLINKNKLSYDELIGSRYFQSKSFNFELFSIPLTLNKNRFLEYVSNTFFTHILNYDVTHYLKINIRQYITHNFLQNTDNDLNLKTNKSSEYSKYSNFLEFTQSLLDLKYLGMEKKHDINFFKLIACEYNPSLIFTLEDEKKNDMLNLLSSSTSSNNFIDKYSKILFNCFSTYSTNMVGILVDKIIEHYGINSVNEKFINIIANNPSTLGHKFSLLIDKNHDIYKAKNHKKLLQLLDSNVALLEHSSLNFWKKFLVSDDFGRIVKKDIFSYAPKETDKYIDEIFQSFIQHPNSGYDRLQMTHNTALQLLLKLSEHQDKMDELKNKEYEKDESLRNLNNFYIHYEKDFFAALLQYIDPNKLHEEFQFNNKTITVENLILNEISYFGNYYNTASYGSTPKIKMNITKDEYSKVLINFLKQLDPTTLMNFTEANYHLPEGVFLSAISLMSDKNQKNALTLFISNLAKDIKSVEKNKTSTEIEEYIYNKMESSTGLKAVFICYKNNIGSIKFEFLEEALTKIEPYLYMIDNSSNNYLKLLLVNKIKPEDDTSKSAYKDVPFFENFSEFIQVVFSNVSKRNMIKDLNEAKKETQAVEEPTKPVVRKIKKF